MAGGEVRMGTHTQNREMKTNESVIKRQILRDKK